MQDYGVERLPFLKGAPQEVNRINRFLRPAGLATLQATAVQKSRLTAQDESRARDAGASTDRKGKGKQFDIVLVPPVPKRSIPQGLNEYRDRLALSTAASDCERKRVAAMVFADVRAHHLQALVDTFREEGREPATLALERALVRALFNHAKTSWNWAAPASNPAAGMKLPAIDNARDRVMSLEEESRIDEALKGCRNKLVGPTLALLWETGMRSSETLKHVTWSNVNWEADSIKLDDRLQAAFHRFGHAPRQGPNCCGPCSGSPWPWPNSGMTGASSVACAAGHPVLLRCSKARTSRFATA